MDYLSGLSFKSFYYYSYNLLLLLFTKSKWMIRSALFKLEMSCYNQSFLLFSIFNSIEYKNINTRLGMTKYDFFSADEYTNTVQRKKSSLLNYLSRSSYFKNFEFVDEVNTTNLDRNRKLKLKKTSSNMSNLNFFSTSIENKLRSEPISRKNWLQLKLKFIIRNKKRFFRFMRRIKLYSIYKSKKIKRLTKNRVRLPK